jgi:hypothetical protein
MTVAEIKKAVESLSQEQRRELSAWLWELDADDWDRQMKADAEAGRLDRLAKQALDDHRAGRTRPVPGPQDIDEADVA